MSPPPTPTSDRSPTPLRALLREGAAELARQRPAVAAEAAVLTRLLQVQRLVQPPLQASPTQWQPVAADGRVAAFEGPVHGPARSPRAGWRLGRRATAAMGLLTLFVLAAWFGPPQPQALQARGAKAAWATHPDQDAAFGGFVPVVSAQRWRQALGARAEAPVWLLRAELPRTQLAAMGLPVDAARAEQPVATELMLNPQGEVLAVRWAP